LAAGKTPGDGWLEVFNPNAKPCCEVAAVEELVHDLRDDGTQKAEPRLVALLVGAKKASKCRDRHCHSGDCLGRRGR